MASAFTDLIRFGRRLPVLCGDDRQAHLSLLVNVRVVNSGLERDLRRLEWVLGLFVKGEGEKSDMKPTDNSATP